MCLPKIDGMHECYTRPNVKAWADQFNYEGNSILAYYLNDSTFAQVDKLGEFTYDDYCQIYVTNKLKDIKCGKSELNEMTKLLEGNFIKESWSEIKGKIEKNLDFVSVGRPVVIENYSPAGNASTFVMLIKMQVAETESVSLMMLNVVLIKERLISVAYYRDYNGEESIKATKAKNDYIVLQIIDENK